MVFSNNFFLLVFLPFFFASYYVSPKKLKNSIALIASLFFYAWGAPTFIFILLFSLLIDFYLVELIHTSNSKRKKYLLTFTVIINIIMLGYFKYANFFVAEFNSMFSFFNVKFNFNWNKVALPIGISFITFHKLTYAIDTYRGKHEPLKSFSNYLLYILMFPHQIAGPIVRYSEIADQIENRDNGYHIDNYFFGAYRFVIGLSKKVLIANTLGEVATKVFDLPINEISSSTAWIGILAYTFQIYFDFSGYSDMAIGLAKMMGFTFPENFNMPYISQNITEFWRRWHITLGRFMKDYLYIPLGGNKVSKVRNLINLWVVFLVSGLWHGASWTFVIWGAYHGLLLILDRVFLIKILSYLFKPLQTLFTFILVIIGWVFFKANTVSFSLQYLRKMFFPFKNNIPVFETSTKFWSILFLAFVICTLPMFKKYNTILQFHATWPSILLKGIILILLFVLCVIGINSSGFNPFIYYRF
jgi:alginate O-acetyltransferase complex protein AlgI